MAQGAALLRLYCREGAAPADGEESPPRTDEEAMTDVSGDVSATSGSATKIKVSVVRKRASRRSRDSTLAPSVPPGPEKKRILESDMVGASWTLVGPADIPSSIKDKGKRTLEELLDESGDSNGHCETG